MDTTIAPLASIGIDIGKEVFHLVGCESAPKAFAGKFMHLLPTGPGSTFGAVLQSHLHRPIRRR